ncbi:hypothetical protein [Novosphingobium sp.]|uniref:hypothetical protein n=1 Tax=Novosphingobium sp. TaxID=1874826 RepID=UPI002FE12286
MGIGYYDPVERMAEKARARAALDEALASGRLSPAEANRQNFLFAGVDFSKARILIKDPPPEL